MLLLASADFFFSKLTFSKTSFKTQSVKPFGSRSGPNYLQRLSADNQNLMLACLLLNLYIDSYGLGFCVVCGLTSQSTAMVMLRPNHTFS